MLGQALMEVKERNSVEARELQVLVLLSDNKMVNRLATSFANCQKNAWCPMLTFRVQK